MPSLRSRNSSFAQLKEEEATRLVTRVSFLRLAQPECFRHNSAMKKISAKNSMRPFSSILVDGPERAAARAMLYPVGFTEADFKKPIIGIASTWSNVTPCNMHIDKLALEAEKGANEGGGMDGWASTMTLAGHF